MESAVNTPHPDDEDESKDFFDLPEETEPAKEPDPATFDPTSGGFAPPGPSDAAAEAAAYREEKGEPTPEPLAQQERLRAIAEREVAEAKAKAAEAKAAEEVQPEPDPPAEVAAAETTEETVETPASGAESAPSGDAEKKSGSQDREYLVFQKVPLTKRALTFLLEQIEKGREPEPRIAYLELHRVVARNDKQAIADAYKTHREQLGEECELAGVSSRSFKRRKVKPRTRPAEEALDIS